TGFTGFDTPFPLRMKSSSHTKWGISNRATSQGLRGGSVRANASDLGCRWAEICRNQEMGRTNGWELEAVAKQDGCLTVMRSGRRKETAESREETVYVAWEISNEAAMWRL